MNQSSQNISGQQNASSQLNTGCSVNAHPNYPRMIKILFVCHGNICRSTMAQYVMLDLVEKNGLADSLSSTRQQPPLKRLVILLTLVRDASFSKRGFVAAIIVRGR